MSTGEEQREKKAEAGNELAAAVLESLGVEPPEEEVVLEPGELEEEEGPAGFYRREAIALRDRFPERGALMFLEAALASEREGSPKVLVTRDLKSALELAPQALWLLPAARRLYMRTQQYVRALELIERELKVSRDPLHKIAILLEASELERHVRRDHESALAYVKRALQIDGHHIGALSAALALYAELGADEETAATLEALAASLSVPSERALLHYGSASILEMRLDDWESAQRSYLAALQADAAHLPAMLALWRLQERRGDWSSLVRNLEHAVDLIPDAQGRADTLYQVGALRADHRFDSEAAARHLWRSLEEGGPSLNGVLRLIYVHDLRRDVRKLVDAFRYLLGMQEEAASVAAIYTRVGWILHRRGNMPSEARDAYLAALESVELYDGAFVRLCMLLREQQDFVALEALMSAASDGASMEGVEARAARYIELAELRFRLGMDKEAVLACTEAMNAPRLHSAFWLLKHLLEKLGSNRARATAIRGHLERASDPKTRNALVGELVRLMAGSLDELEGAIGQLELVEDGNVNRALSLDFIELLTRAGKHKELVAALIEAAHDSVDLDEGDGWLIQASRVLAEELGEVAESLRLLERVLERRGGHTVAVQLVRRLALEHGHWKELISVLHHLLEVSPGRSDAPQVYYEIGWSHEELGNTGNAIQAYEQALSYAPQMSESVWSLERLLRQEERWAQLVDGLFGFAANADEEEGIGACVRGGEVADWILGELELAVKLYERGLEIDIEDRFCLYGLLRVELRRSNWRRVLELLDRLTALLPSERGEERSRLLLLAARVREGWLQESPDLSLYTEAARGSVSEGRLRGELTRVRRVVQAEDMAEWLNNLGARTEDTDLAASYYLESGVLFEFERGELRLALGPIQEAFRRRPDDERVVWSMERVLSAGRYWRELAQLRERAAALGLLPAARVQTLSGAILPYVKAGALQDAERVARECLNYDAHCMPALLALLELAEERRDWVEMASLCDRLAEACTDDGNRFHYCLRAAELWDDHVGETTRALASLAVALSHEPAHPQAFSAAERMLRQRGEFAELSRLYVRAIAASESESKVRLFRRHSELLRVELGDVARASAELNRLLMLTPDDIDALSSQADLLGEQGRWSESVATLETIAERTHSTEMKRSARMRQVRILLDRLRHPERGREILERILSDCPGDFESQQQLVELDIQDGRWEAARERLHGMAEEGETHEQVWAAIKLVEVARRALWRDAERKEYEAGALSAALHDSEALGELVETYSRNQEISRLVEVGRALLAQGPDPSEDAKLKATIARLLVAGGQHKQALSFLSGIIREDPDSETDWAYHARAQALEANNQLEASLSEYRRTLLRNVYFVDAYPGYVRVLDQLGQRDAADAASALLDVLGEADYIINPSLSYEEVPTRAIDFGRFEVPEEVREVDTLIASVSDYLGDLFPLDIRFEQLASDDEVNFVCRRIANSMGISLRAVGVAELGEDGPSLAAVGLPATIILDSELVKMPRHPRFAFWVARALAECATCGALVQQLDDEELEQLLEAITQRKPSSPETKALRKAVIKAVPRAYRKGLKSGANLPQCNWETLREAVEVRADSVGLVVVRAPQVGLAELGKEAISDELISFIIGERFQLFVDFFWGKAELSDLDKESK